ncbi:hypothetical protein N665_1250s0013 [Sinapis alba]|nr:hypothetical protein N665_1250s0013 [Sinapis alba]
MEEESSERLVRLGQHETLEFPLTGNRETTTVDVVAIQSTPQDLPLAAEEIYDCTRLCVDFLSYRFITTTEPDIFSCFAPLRCSDKFFILPHEEEESQRTRSALPKARPRRDPPPRVSRRSSQVSPPIYLRHRFLPQSRKGSSSRRQR